MNHLDTINAALKALPYPQKPEGLYEPISYVLSMGGKRLRPVLTLLAYGLYREDVERAVPAALALETYHNHTLLHDDLMDNADVRRGMPTVHKKWDANTAVLSGDTMLIMACRKMMETSTPHLRELMDLFLRTQQEICEGQQYDVNFETRTDVAVEEYIEMIRLKTSVLLACALQCGALIADAPVADQQLLYDFGQYIGLAFQLQDDYLDCYGDPAVFGKAIGGDIRCGKKTFMLISAVARADEADAETLLTSRDPSVVLPLYERHGIPQLAREKMQEYYAKALAVLEKLNVPAERKQVLWEYAEALLKREK
ncbi:MAG: polyprenyl synthetase family protein [Bacteroidaceae bacterium]|nr:polyprenyl synthetase family protein [Bacteroidaceae bacterium]